MNTYRQGIGKIKPTTKEKKMGGHGIDSDCFHIVVFKVDKTNIIPDPYINEYPEPIAWTDLETKVSLSFKCIQILSSFD